MDIINLASRLGSLCRAVLAVLLLTAGFGAGIARAQLFDNLRALGGLRYSVGDPNLTLTNEVGAVIDGPKDVAAADLDGDGNADLVASDKDGSVTVGFGLGDGTFGPARILRAWVGAPLDAGRFAITNVTSNVYCDFQPTNQVVECYTNIFFPPLLLRTNRICLTNLSDGTVWCTNQVIVVQTNTAPPYTNIFCLTNAQYGCVGQVTNWVTNVWSEIGPFGLRGLALADFTGDGRRDIAVAAPGEALIYLFPQLPARQFGAPIKLAGWFGNRDLATGDFDGDGRPDLLVAGTTNGVVQMRGLGGGQFSAFPALTNLASEAELGDSFDFPQPAYYLRAFRAPGMAYDEAVVSHAQSGQVWLLHQEGTGPLRELRILKNVDVTSLDVGPILQPATAGALPDLVTAFSRGGYLDVYPGTNDVNQFHGQIAQRIYIPGAPRNVRIVDLDGDGWNDVVVVAQAYDRVMIYKNNQGVLSLMSETTTGRFPREMDVADFNNDAHPDLAVLNRYSSDVTILLTSTNLTTPTGFLALDSVYPVDGNVSGLELVDFNQDGRPDVMQLHRDTSEFSVRLTGADGRLGAPAYYSITNASNPAAQVATDVDGDGHPDMVSANLSGSITVRLGRPDGTFGPEQTFQLPEGRRNGLFALVPGDFDGDGKMDLAAGYLDCRVAFFKGDGTGQFIWIRTDEFIYEPRSMVAGDFDQDGDLDLAGGALTGRFVVVENTGALFSNTPLVRHEYAGPGRFDSNLQLVEANGDHDPDLLFGYPGGFALFFGGPGLTFSGQALGGGRIDPAVAGNVFVFADLDGDGDKDIASVCSSNTCLSVYAQTNGIFGLALNVPVPFTRYLATGDLDGDGFADLLGTGDVLWVALSSRRASNAPPAQLLGARADRGVTINEVLAANSGVPLLADGGRTSDFVELYNGSTTAANLGGWTLSLIRTNFETVVVTNGIGGADNQFVVVTNVVISTNLYAVPPGTVMAAGSRLLLVCADRLRTPLHTGYNLPAEGGLLLLQNADRAEVDRVVYPGLASDQSYARYTDGARRFVVNSIPSPSSPNVDNGAITPTLELIGVDLETVRDPRRSLRVRAFAQDDIGLVNVSLLWRRLDVQDNETKRVILYDDGINEDGPGGDGRFMGVFDEPLPPGSEIQFYLECTDITGQVDTTPGSPRFVAAGRPAEMHALAIGYPAPPLEISELVADNRTGLPDERGGHPSWIEIRNISGEPVPVGAMSLGPRLFGNSDRLSLSNTVEIRPGEHLVVFADNNPGQGQLHAPFKLDPLGGDLQLWGVRPSGARYPIDAIRYGPQGADVGLSRLGRGGVLVANQPTPRSGNVAGPWQAFHTPDGIVFAFSTQPGTTITIEGKTQWDDPEWMVLQSGPSVGVEEVVPEIAEFSLFLRVRVEPK